MELNLNNRPMSNEEYQSEAYRLAEEFSERTNRCLFITGKAGTGKTTFLKKLREVSRKNIAVVAPTGVAAINANGMTIHSFFQLPIRTLIPTPQSYRQMFAEQRMTQRKRQMFSHLEMLVIDEISMVRSDVLDAIDAILKHYRYRRNEPFGGVQVVMIGDLMQLQPVVQGYDDRDALAKYYQGPYFFQSKVMQQVQPVYLELDHVFRQQNEQFVRLLNEVRDNRLSEESRNMLAARYMPYYLENSANDTKNFHITLTTHNRQADDLNNRRLDEIKAKQFSFTAAVKNTFPETSYPTDETLKIKEGAKVMFIRNDDQKPRRFYNGKLGIVKSINADEQTIVVSCDDGDIAVEPMKWENIRYKEDPETGNIEEEVLGSFTQFPLRLAWAITIHKSQGLTFDNVIIDAEHAFAAGQVYVALSRCRTLDGIILTSPLQNVSLTNDHQVIDYIHQQPTTQQSAAQLEYAAREYQWQLFTDIYNLSRVNATIEQMQRHVLQCVSFSEQTLPFLDTLKKQINDLTEVSEKFQRQLTQIILQQANPTTKVETQNYLQQRMTAAAGYFVPKIKEWTNMVSEHPCRCKNKGDAADFDAMITDVHLVLSQKIVLMEAVAKEATAEAYLKAKSTFAVDPMQIPSTFAKPQKKEKTAVAKEEDKDLFEALRALRLSIIASNNAPAYTVFPDKTLHEMASRKPTTLTQMEQISGVGKKKIEQYGDIFMEKIREYLGITD